MQEKGKPALYVKLNKALYGCIKSAILWYTLYVGTLRDFGFKINACDECAVLKMI